MGEYAAEYFPIEKNVLKKRKLHNKGYFLDQEGKIMKVLVTGACWLYGENM